MAWKRSQRDGEREMEEETLGAPSELLVTVSPPAGKGCLLLS